MCSQLRFRSVAPWLPVGLQANDNRSFTSIIQSSPFLFLYRRTRPSIDRHVVSINNTTEIALKIRHQPQLIRKKKLLDMGLGINFALIQVGHKPL